MKTIHVKQDFEGYPHGGKEGEKAVKFVTGQEIEVSDAFADMVVDKGHARLVDAPAAEPGGKGKGRGA
jgi:hypothetical protein